MTTPLAGVRVLVTRPRPQAAGLIERLQAAGAGVVEAPTLAIEPIGGEAVCRRAAELAGRADWLVFVSPSAVQHGVPVLRSAGIDPRRRALAAVGPGTARALAAAGWPRAVAPQAGGGADALLALPAFSPAPGAHAVIVRGEGGRETLAEGLRERGAAVAYLEVYRRRPAAVDPALLRSGWQSGAVAVTIVTSESGLRGLLAATAADERPRLLGTRVVAASERLAAEAARSGFRHRAVVAAGAGDDELLAAVRRAASEAYEETQ